MHHSTHPLPAKPPFDLKHSLAFLNSFAPTRGEQMTAASLLKSTRVGGQTVAFRVTQHGPPDAPELEAELFSQETLTEQHIQRLLARLRFFLSLDDDPQALRAKAAHDPAFLKVLDARDGYHHVKFLTPFENAVWAVLSQRTPLKVARSAKRKLTEQFGGSLEVDGQTLSAFPEASDLPADAAALETVLNNPRKSKALAAVVEGFQQVDETWLKTAPDADIRAWLLSLYGIGEWSVSFIMLRGLGRMSGALDVADDSVLMREMLKAAEPVYGPLTPDELREKGAAYGELEGLWAHLLRSSGE